MSVPSPPIAQRFELRHFAGEGGMGRVYQAMDRSTGRIVALKVLHAQLGDDARFQREAKLLASIRHPHVVGYIDSGTMPTGERFLAMEWLEGETLAQRLARGALEWQQALAIGIRIASALAAAHDATIVHRDLKPSNVFLVGGDVNAVRVLDFGIARAKNTTLLTRSDEILGTPGYMAPEQILADAPVGPPADVYALGAVLFQCIAGRLPYDAESRQALMVRAASEPAPRLRTFAPYVPAGLDQLIGLMLEHAPERRPRDGAQAEKLLRNLEHGPAESLAPAPAPGPGTAPGPAPEGPTRGITLPRWVVALLVALPVLATVTVAGIVLASRDSTAADEDEDEDEDDEDDDAETAERQRDNATMTTEAMAELAMCRPPRKCYLDVLDDERMPLRTIAKTITKNARKELPNKSIIIYFMLTNLDTETMTVDRSPLSLTVQGPSHLWAFTAFDDNVVLDRQAITPSNAFDGAVQRCTPEEVIRRATGDRDRRIPTMGANYNWSDRLWFVGPFEDVAGGFKTIEDDC